MPVLKAFKAFRPSEKYVKQVAAKPYDVISREEAQLEIENNPYSFYRIIKPEIIEVKASAQPSRETIYEKAQEAFSGLLADGVFQQDEEACFYLYAQTLGEHTQVGLVAASSLQDYRNNVIKKHELTRPDKEKDRVEHIKTTGINAGPVFMAYKDNLKINGLVNYYTTQAPLQDFVLEDNIRHQIWKIADKKAVQQIEQIFQEEVEAIYIADGHHRTEAAAQVAEYRKANNPAHTGEEDYNFFLTVNFPMSQLNIIDYNRVVKDLNGLSADEFLGELAKSFEVKTLEAKQKPQALHQFSLYLEGTWYSLEAKAEILNDNDPVKCLDVSVLSDHILEPLLNIKDLRTSDRIAFVGGVRGLEALEHAVDSGKMKAAFALHPVTIQQLVDISDNDLIMPPKVTWFEPKLRSGLFVYAHE